jgi:hypothetical protein
VFGVLLVCWVIVVVLSGVPVLVVLSEKHPVNERARIEAQITILVVVSIKQIYSSKSFPARWGSA